MLKNILLWTYLLNFVFLVMHETDAAYWKEWKFFGKLGASLSNKAGLTIFVLARILLAAHSLGYGSVWLAFPPILKAAKEVVEIHGEIVGVLPIGHPADHQKEYFDRSRKPVEEVAEFYG